MCQHHLSPFHKIIRGVCLISLFGLLAMEVASTWAVPQAPQAPATQAAPAAPRSKPAHHQDANTSAPAHADRLPASPDAVLRKRASAAALVPGGAKVAIIPIRGMIYGFTLDSLKRRVKRAMDNNATVIVLEMDTPGGLVISALDIAKYIKGQITVPTLAWINDQAYSAGILIASACDQIIMSPASTTGDCAPIVPGKQLAPTERAKALSPILEEFRDNAQNNGYDYALFHAMCVLGVEVYQIQNPKTGRIRLVNQIDKQFMVDGKTPGQAGKTSGWQRLLGNTPAPASQPMNNVGMAVSLDVATRADKGQWKLLRQIHDGKTLLTLNQTRAVAAGLAQSDKIRTTGDLKKYLGAASIHTVSQTWSEDLSGWLTSPGIRAILVMALLLGGYLEMQSPGLGLPGAVAGVALVLLVVAPMLIGLADVWHILLMAAGIGLLLAEIFIIPGFGVTGVAGLICLFTGLVLAVIPSSGSMPLPPPEMYGYLQTTTLWMMVSFLMACVGFFFITRYFNRIPGLNRLILPAVENPVDFQSVSGSERLGQGAVQLGAVGFALTELRPIGQAQLGEQVVDVISEGRWIAVGQRVKVIQIKGNRILVQEITTHQT